MTNGARLWSGEHDRGSGAMLPASLAEVKGHDPSELFLQMIGEGPEPRVFFVLPGLEVRRLPQPQYLLVRIQHKASRHEEATLVHIAKVLNY